MWKDVLDGFVEELKEHEKVEMVLLVGSYAKGEQTRYSAIDVYIVIDKIVGQKESGCRLVDGYLVEYQVINKTKAQKLIADADESDLKVLFDRTGLAQELLYKTELEEGNQMVDENMLLVNA